ncbi:replication endonuclease [Poseidonibacter lekithochrous]|uniref:replication endonuclease n=1 Tax=Poseidonibacter lekithochrous TaxID=1904463 RepID=UPI000D393AF8|nr:replication endonuclease [Poseidonibacter lekithochrous]
MYGITSHDIKAIDTKILYQKKYLTSRFFDFGEETKSALDFTYSANLNPKKYFAEMNNRINSIFDYAKDLGLKPVFITLTAPSKYHKKNRIGELKINPNETAKALTQIYNKFTSLQIFRKLKKQLGHGLVYFRVYEPHKSGVPHLHAMLFLPNDYILDVKKKFFSYFTDTQRWNNNKKSIDFKYTWYNSAGGAVAYIMKYVTKTFKNDSDMSTQHASYWYIKHNIRRFLCSRTLAPVTIYRKVRHFFRKEDRDYLKVSELIKSNQIKRLFDDTTYSYMYYNHESGEVEDVTVWQKNSDLILQSRIKRNDTFKLSYKKKEHKKALKVFVSDFEKYSFSDDLNKFILMPVVPSVLKDYQLIKYFRILDNADIDTIDYTHYGLVRNEMIKRNLLEEEAMSLNNYRLPSTLTNCQGGSHVPMSFIVPDEVIYDVPYI